MGIGRLFVISEGTVATQLTDQPADELTAVDKMTRTFEGAPLHSSGCALVLYFSCCTACLEVRWTLFF